MGASLMGADGVNDWVEAITGGGVQNAALSTVASLAGVGEALSLMLVTAADGGVNWTCVTGADEMLNAVEVVGVKPRATFLANSSAGFGSSLDETTVDNGELFLFLDDDGVGATSDEVAGANVKPALPLPMLSFDEFLEFAAGINAKPTPPFLIGSLP